MENEEIKSTQIPSTPSSFPTPPGSSPKIKNRLIKIVVGIIIITVFGVGIALATRVWDPLWNPFRPEPEEVIDKMAAEMNKLKTLHSRTKIEIRGKEDFKEVFKLFMDFSTDSDKSDPKTLKSAGEFYISLSFEGTQFSLAGESREIGKASYLKLTTIPLPLQPFFLMIGFDLNQLKDQWIKLDMEEFSKELIESLGTPITPEIEQEFQKAKEREEKIIQKIQTLFQNKKIYVVKKEFPDKKIGGEKVYHYSVALNEAEIKKIMPEIFDILWENYLEPQFQMMTSFLPPSEQPPNPKEEIRKEFLKTVDELFAKIGEISAELWIGKKDYLLYKVEGEKIIDLSKLKESKPGVSLPPTQRREMIIFSLIIDFSDFNQPLEIEAPKEYNTLKEIFKSPTLSPLLPGAFPSVESPPAF
jgi:hypothetical protein